MTLLWRLYKRRLINVNVNIIAAGLLALVPTVIVVHLITELGGFPPPDQFKQRQKLFITGVTFALDIFFDVAIYYGLHWLANHLPARAPKPSQEFEEAAQPTFMDDDKPKPAFLKDATQVQLERMALSPLFYVVALGGQHALMHAHVDAASATAIGFGVAILLTRVLHTLWMLRQARRARQTLKPPMPVEKPAA
jgi:hypothetical protein